MNLEKFLEIMDSGEEIIAGSKEHQFMHYLSQEALKITMELNSRYPNAYGKTYREKN